MQAVAAGPAKDLARPDGTMLSRARWTRSAWFPFACRSIPTMGGALRKSEPAGRQALRLSALPRSRRNEGALVVSAARASGRREDLRVRWTEEVVKVMEKRG